MFRGLFRLIESLDRERRSQLLLVSIVLFFVLPPLIETREIGRLALLLNLYVTLVVSTMELAEKRVVFLSAIPIGAASMILLAVSHFHPTRMLLIANGVALTAFLGLVSSSLFVYLGAEGQINSGHIYVSVSLYFLLGMSWYSIYNLANILQPGSLVQGGTPLPADTPMSTMLYFSLVTLTTLGYGDIVPVTPVTRMFTTLEATAGVLYVAITVARLVSGSRPRTRE
jgi:hypothetical protein